MSQPENKVWLQGKRIALLAEALVEATRQCVVAERSRSDKNPD